MTLSAQMNFYNVFLYLFLVLDSLCFCFVFVPATFIGIVQLLQAHDGHILMVHHHFPFLLIVIIFFFAPLPH
jgi:hypothetical protein